MIPIDPTVSGRRRASKVYLSLSGAAGPRGSDLANPAAAPWPFDRPSPEIGSLPVNVLAIALALATAFSDPDRGLD
jgi:hypothetical protein